MHLTRNIGCDCGPVCGHAGQEALQLWQLLCSYGSNCKSCYGAGYVHFPPTVRAAGITYMVLIGGVLHCKQSSCCSAPCFAALCRSHRLLGLQATLYVHPGFAVRVEASLCECAAGLVLTIAQRACLAKKDAALQHAYELVHAHTAGCTQFYVLHMPNILLCCPRHKCHIQATMHSFQ